MADPILQGQLNGAAKEFGNRERAARKFLRYRDEAKATLEGCAAMARDLRDRPEEANMVKVLAALCASMTKLAAAQKDICAFAAIQTEAGENGDFASFLRSFGL